MLFKKLIGFGMIAGVALNIGTVMADGLSLQSKNISSPIAASCNDLSYELQPNTSVNDLSWGLIALVLGSSVNCTFSLDDTAHTPVGTAQLNLNADLTEGEILIAQSNPDYAISVTPNQNVFAQSVTVSIQKK